MYPLPLPPRAKSIPAKLCQRGLGLASACLLLATLGFAAMPLPKTTSSTQRLSLGQAKDIALDQNQDLRTARGDIEAAIGMLATAQEVPNPTLNASISKIRIGQSQSVGLGNSFFDRNYDNIVAVSELVEIGKRTPRKISAKSALAAARAKYEETRRQLYLSVSRAYVAALLGDESLRILNDSAASLRKESNIGKDRLKLGDLSVSDEDQILIAADRLELDAKVAANNALAARIQLQTLLGAGTPNGDVTLTDHLSDFSMTADHADGERPDIIAAEALVRKSEADLKLSKAQRIPDPTISLQFEREAPDNLHSIGVAVSFALPLFNRNKGAIHSAEAALDQAQAMLVKTHTQVNSDITTAIAAYKEASARLARYEEEIKPKARQVRESITFAYEKGGASLLDLLAAQRSDNDIRESPTERCIGLKPV